jgi:hypothetical protein
MDHFNGGTSVVSRLLDEIELRAEVEIAKLSRRISAAGGRIFAELLRESVTTPTT